MDHSDLIAELSEIEKMTPAERIALARLFHLFLLLNYINSFMNLNYILTHLKKNDFLN